MSGETSEFKNVMLNNPTSSLYEIKGNNIESEIQALIKPCNLPQTRSKPDVKQSI